MIFSTSSQREPAPTPELVLGIDETPGICLHCPQKLLATGTGYLVATEAFPMFGIASFALRHGVNLSSAVVCRELNRGDHCCEEPPMLGSLGNTLGLKT